jgi:hypothetical protein
MKYCPRIKSLLTSEDFKTGFISVTRMRCRQWDCEFCKTKNGNMWRAHLLRQFCENFPDKRWVFITITAPSYAHKDAQKSLKVLKRAWGSLYDRLRHKNGGSLSFVLIWETHKSGIFHLHALVDMGSVYDASDYDWQGALQHMTLIEAEKEHPFCKWLSKAATKSKAGWVCHARRIREGETGKDNARLAIGYVTKYFVKGLGDLPLPKRWRRVQTSRDIGSPRTAQKDKFTWRMRAYIDIPEYRAHPHWLINENRKMGPVDFDESGIYPSLYEE